LLEPAAIASMRELLLPLATVITLNLREAELLTGRRIAGVADMREAALVGFIGITPHPFIVSITG
jgi:hydroxymethylpyrimidine/phosphomethylpyrimidine kinase